MTTRLLQSARKISVLTLVSRVLGLVRDMACSFAFGAGGVFSAFTVAFQIPNLFRRLFGEGALSAASIPVMTSVLAQQGPEAASALARRIVGLLLLVLIAACAAGELVVLGIYLLTDTKPESVLVLQLTAVTLPYLILVCTVAILGGMQNVFGRFGVPALMPVVLNLFMIAGALSAPIWFGPNDAGGVFLLALSVVGAGATQLLIQWRATRRCGLSLRPLLDLRDPAIRRIAITMLPMVAGLGAIQINTLADALIAWWFVAEEVTASAGAERVGPGVLYYAQRLYQFPLGVFALALATVIFPALSRHAAEGDMPGLGQTLTRGIRVATFEAMPCLLGLILVREPLVQVLFNRGEFAEWPEAGDRVAYALAFYALGIWAYAINHLVVRAFYAVHDVRTPLRIAVVMVVVNVALNLVLVQTVLKEAGLALATSICATVQVILQVWVFRRKVGHVNWRSLVPGTAKVFLASGAMAAAVYGVDLLSAGNLGSFARLGALVATGGVAYVAAAWLLRCEELRELLRR